MSIDSIVDEKISQKVGEIAIGPRGKSNYEIAVENGFTGTEAEWLLSLRGANGIGGTPEVPSWMPVNNQVGAGWAAFQESLLAMQQKCKALPRSTAGKTNLTASFPTQTNHIGSALSLPENRHYLAPHTGSPANCRVADIQTLQNAAQVPDIGSGSGRSGGMVAFPDGEILVVPYMAGSYYVMQPATETGYALAAPAPSNYAFLGGALWIDGESALLAPHNQNYAVLVNKRTGVVEQLTGYNFGGNYACAGVRRHGPTGWYAFAPHNHNKYVFLDPETKQFHVMPFNAPGGEAFVGISQLHDGSLYYATHKHSCSVVIDPVAKTIKNTLPPSGSGYVAPTAGISNFRTSITLPDGRVLLVPFSHTKAWIYDPVTEKHTQCPGTYSFGAVACASLTMWGDVMLWPWNGATAFKVSTGYGFMIDPQIVTSPLFNGL